METCRLDIIRSRYDNTELNNNARTVLLQPHLEASSTSRSYQRGQDLFLIWAAGNKVSPTHFSPIDLVNFLSDMYISGSYAVSTIQLFRSDVSQLHHKPTVLTESVELNKSVQVLQHQAQPVRLHRPTIDVKPTFNYISSLDGPSIPLSRLQMKLHFF
jgi:hypothetical protein